MFGSDFTENIILTDKYIGSLLPDRKKDCNKGDFGRLLIVASCFSMTGAGVICAKAALRSGAGLVEVASTSDALLPLKISLPEALTFPLTAGKGGAISKESADAVIKRSELCNALVLGCGLSVCDDTRELVKNVLENIKIPIVLDADGINIVSENIDILGNISVPVIITPHLKEMSRLCSLSVKEIKQSKSQVALEFAEKHGVYVVLKDFETVIATPDGKVFIHCGGHPCMAKGGSGDMLAGIIGAFCTQGMKCEDAACAAVFLHGRAGEICGNEMGDRCVLASDMVDALPYSFKSVK